MAPAARIVGRSSSHFTRLVRIFAEETGIGYALSPVGDMASLDPADYGDNPALKLPVLHLGAATVFGAQNICRALAEAAPEPRRIIWPEDLREVTARNAQELVWHAMQAQVQLAFGTQVVGLPGDNAYFGKAAASLKNALGWLEANAPAVISALPPRDLSMFEASLFCLLEHLAFRSTTQLPPCAQLNAFVRDFGARASAQKTPYGFDAPAGGA